MNINVRYCGLTKKAAFPEKQPSRQVENKRATRVEPCAQLVGFDRFQGLMPEFTSFGL